MNVEKSVFGVCEEGEVMAYFLKNKRGMSMRLMDYGPTVMSLTVLDRQGREEDIVLGFDDLASYQRDRAYLGVIVGRYGNRIDRGCFTLDGASYCLPCNEAIFNNHLHGGENGFHRHLWSSYASRKEDEASVCFTRVSPDGEEGYPGNLKTYVTITLTADNSLVFDYKAESDRTTIVNMTHHGYFNLSGQGSGDICRHKFWIAADYVTEVNDRLIPTGSLLSVEGRGYDFRCERALQDAMEGMRDGAFDINYVLRGGRGELREVARVYDPKSGRLMSMRTTEPGVQFYNSAYMDGSLLGKRGVLYGAFSGFCLEAQHFPDSPNHDNFPSTLLRPGDMYHQKTVYHFSTRQGMEREFR